MMLGQTKIKSRLGSHRLPTTRSDDFYG